MAIPVYLWLTFLEIPSASLSAIRLAVEEQPASNKSYLKSILDRNPNRIIRWYTVYRDEYKFFEDTGKKLIALKD